MQFHVHAHLELGHLSLVDETTEDDIAHVGNLGHRRTFGEGAGA